MEGYQSSGACLLLNSNMTTYEDCLEECLNTYSCRAITFDSTNICTLYSCTTASYDGLSQVFIKRECDAVTSNNLKHIVLVLSCTNAFRKE